MSNNKEWIKIYQHGCKNNLVRGWVKDDLLILMFRTSLTIPEEYQKVKDIKISWLWIYENVFLGNAFYGQKNKHNG